MFRIFVSFLNFEIIICTGISPTEIDTTKLVKKNQLLTKISDFDECTPTHFQINCNRNKRQKIFVQLCAKEHLYLNEKVTCDICKKNNDDSIEVVSVQRTKLNVEDVRCEKNENASEKKLNLSTMENASINFSGRQENKKVSNEINNDLQGITLDREVFCLSIMDVHNLNENLLNSEKKICGNDILTKKRHLDSDENILNHKKIQNMFHFTRDTENVSSSGLTKDNSRHIDVSIDAEPSLNEDTILEMNECGNKIFLDKFYIDLELKGMSIYQNGVNLEKEKQKILDKYEKIFLKSKNILFDEDFGDKEETYQKDVQNGSIEILKNINKKDNEPSLHLMVDSDSYCSLDWNEHDRARSYDDTDHKTLENEAMFSNKVSLSKSAQAEKSIVSCDCAPSNITTNPSFILRHNNLAIKNINIPKYDSLFDLPSQNVIIPIYDEFVSFFAEQLISDPEESDRNTLGTSFKDFGISNTTIKHENTEDNVQQTSCESIDSYAKNSRKKKCSINR
ncbi:hypothetical protein EDEG_03928 [Edhazardia aedis USNM 41457]|uniref:Uncharacterized protein n=1 Tax=Edhazardia aedis (strain USNM 41457) TaxID=1003232 RepID=J9DJD1_EDHAE|nr:hypothetical protein EDEG_03928 [Edhazardia aedis USNM 41457]|eukprot:EJW01487.1 hypothetical protein EDEG_03928 [Edhazardia aedis USNM 41457]